MILESILYLALALYHEARSEPQHCQLFVADVIKNRAKNRELTIKDTVLEKNQFSAFNKGLPDIKEKDVYKKIYKLAKSIYDEKPTSNYDHYHTLDVSPYWNKNLYKGEVCGRHIFYSNNPTYSIKQSTKEESPYDIYIRLLGE